jgi:hypothetical protein
MRTLTSLLVLFCLAAFTSPGICHAASATKGGTIPAGTHLVVKTTEPVGSTDAAGTRFAAKLVEDVVVNGRVVLPAGTKCTGQIATSQRLMASKDRLTVDLKDVAVGGHSVPVKTTGAVPLESYTSPRGVSLSRGGYQVAAGRILHFQLGHSIKL